MKNIFGKPFIVLTCLYLLFCGVILYDNGISTITYVTLLLGAVGVAILSAIIEELK